MARTLVAFYLLFLFSTGAELLGSEPVKVTERIHKSSTNPRFPEKIVVGLDEQAIISTVSKKDYTLGLRVLLNEFLTAEGIVAELIPYNDGKKLADDLKERKLDMITADSRTIVEYIPYAGMQSGITGYRYNKKDVQTVVLLARTDEQRPLEQLLRGKIAINGDNVIDLYVRTLMLENHHTKEPDYLQTSNAQQSILKLYFKKSDLAAVDMGSFKMAYELNPQLVKELTILKTIPLSHGAISLIRSDYPKPMHDRVIAIVDKVNTSTRGKQLLRLFHADKIDESGVDQLETVIALKKRYDTLYNDSLSTKKGKKRD